MVVARRSRRIIRLVLSFTLPVLESLVYRRWIIDATASTIFRTIIMVALSSMLQILESATIPLSYSSSSRSTSTGSSISAAVITLIGMIVVVPWLLVAIRGHAILE